MRVTDRKKGLNSVDGMLLLFVSFMILDSLYWSGSADAGPFVASLIVVATSLIAAFIVCPTNDAVRWTVRYMTAFLLAMLFGMFSFTERMFDVPRWVELPLLLLFASLPVFMSFVKSEREPAHRWLAFAMCLGLMVAMFSGSAGAGDSMIVWLQDKFDWTLEQAQISTRVFRKTVSLSQGEEMHDLLRLQH